MLSKRATYFLGGLVIFVLAGYVLYPSLRTFAFALDADNLSSFFGSWSSANIQALYNSVLISILSVLGGGVLGTLLAYVFFRYDFPLRGFLSGLAVMPLALPPLVGVLAFLFLYGESGILPRALQMVFGLEEAPFSFEGLSAVWMVHVYTLYVYFYLFVSAALRRLDQSILEAAADLGAGQARTFLSIILPQLKPALTSASLLVFMISMASFTAPYLFANTENFMTLQIFNYKTNGDLAMSATVSTILTLICLAFLLALELRPSSQSANAGSKGMAPQAIPVSSGLGKAVAFAGSSILILFLMLPVATIILLSFAQEGSWTVQLIPARYTFENYTALFTNPKVLDPILNSVQMAFIATIGNVIFGVVAALLIVKSSLPGRTLIRLLAVLPFAIPGTVIAVNLIVSFNQPSALILGNVMVGSFWILPLAYFIRHIPLVVRSTMASLQSYNDKLTEASADLGAKAWTTFRRIVWPFIVPGVIAGTLLTFVTALGEFVSSVMLYVFSNRPISVEILSELRLFNFGSAAAYSVFLIILIGLSAWVARWLGSSTFSVGTGSAR